MSTLEELVDSLPKFWKNIYRRQGESEMTEKSEGMGEQLGRLGEKPAPPAPRKKYADMTREEQFNTACEAGLSVFMQRNEEYGDAIKSTGVLGASVELIGNVARLKKLVLKDPEFGKGNREVLLEVLKDIHNYANIALMMAGLDIWGPE